MKPSLGGSLEAIVVTVFLFRGESGRKDEMDSDCALGIYTKYLNTVAIIDWNVGSSAVDGLITLEQDAS